MARPAASGPTEAELEILQVLWRDGPATVRQVHDAIGPLRGTGYTRTLKFMQIMLAKGLLKRDDSVRPQVYAPALSEGQVKRQLVGQLLDRVFHGSSSQFVQQVLSAKKASPKELAEIRRLLGELRKRKE